MREHVRVRIPEGQYKPRDYVKTFNKLIEEVGIVKSRLHYDEHANRIIFVVVHGEVMSVEQCEAASNVRDASKHLCIHE